MQSSGGNRRCLQAIKENAHDNLLHSKSYEKRVGRQWGYMYVGLMSKNLKLILACVPQQSG